MAVLSTSPNRNVADLIYKHLGFVVINKAEDSDPLSESGFIELEGDLYNEITEETEPERNGLKAGISLLLAGALTATVLAGSVQNIIGQYVGDTAVKSEAITIDHSQNIAQSSSDGWGELIGVPVKLSDDELSLVTNLAGNHTLYASESLDSTMVARANSIIAQEFAVGPDGLAERLETRLLGMVDASTSYWESYATSVLNQARSYGSLLQYSQSGIEFFEYSNPGDSRTTAFCNAINGQRFAVETALAHIQEWSELDSTDAMNAHSPFSREDKEGLYIEVDGEKERFASSDINPEFLQRTGMMSPPFHFRCRTLIIPA